MCITEDEPCALQTRMVTRRCIEHATKIEPVGESIKSRSNAVYAQCLGKLKKALSCLMTLSGTAYPVTLTPFAQLHRYGEMSISP